MLPWSTVKWHVTVKKNTHLFDHLSDHDPHRTLTWTYFKTVQMNGRAVLTQLRSVNILWGTWPRSCGYSLDWSSCHYSWTRSSYNYVSVPQRNVTDNQRHFKLHLIPFNHSQMTCVYRFMAWMITACTSSQWLYWARRWLRRRSWVLGGGVGVGVCHMLPSAGLMIYKFTLRLLMLSFTTSTCYFISWRGVKTVHSARDTRTSQSLFDFDTYNVLRTLHMHG